MLLHLVKKDFLIVKKYVLIMLVAAIAIPPVMLWRAPEYGGVMGFILSVIFAVFMLLQYVSLKEYQCPKASALLCAAHFETGALNEYPVFFPSPPFDGTYGCNQMDFAGCEKLAQLRLFKNGRVDLRFTSEDYANQFIDTYLGRGYQESDGEAAV